MGKKITIRLADKYDLERIVKLWAELMNLTAEINPRYRLRSGAEEVQQKVFSELLANDDAFIIVAEAEKRIIAFANGFLTQPAKTFAQSKIGVIENLMVIEPWRRRGLGKELSNRAMAVLHKMGAIEIHVNVIPKNIVSLKFWRALGFEVQRLGMTKQQQ